jgi:hypothetical protein
MVLVLTVMARGGRRSIWVDEVVGVARRRRRPHHLLTFLARGRRELEGGNGGLKLGGEKMG